QVAAPQALFAVTEEGQPGWTRRTRSRPVVLTQDTPDRVLVDFNPESQGNLLCDSRTSPTGIPSFHLHHGIDQFLGRPLRSGAPPVLRRKQQAVLSLDQRFVEMQQRRGFEHDGGTDKTSLADEKCAYTSDEAVRDAQVGRSLAAAIQDEQLMPEQNG